MVASQGLPNGFPYCYGPILNMGIAIDTCIEHGSSRWTPQTTQVFDVTMTYTLDLTREVRQRRGAARRHSSPLSAWYAHCHVSQQALCQTNVLRGMRNASKRVKRSTCRSPLAPYAARTNGPERDDKPTCRTSRANGPHTSVSLERASAHKRSARKLPAES